MIQKFYQSKAWKKITGRMADKQLDNSASQDELLINFLYCIDYPVEKNIVEKTDKIAGWFLCSLPMRSIRIQNAKGQDYTMEYGISRPDVTAIFTDFSANDSCGFVIKSGKEPIDMKGDIVLEAEVETPGGPGIQVKIPLKVTSLSIEDFTVRIGGEITEPKWEETEKQYFEELKKHPWLTIRMDITNKCNLRCIMCHYKEKEIYSQPAKYITAETLKHQLHEIAPYVKHIMLSCGFEPLMSKHFTDIVSMLHHNYPHMEIGMVTNGMLLDSKARKAIIENHVTHVLLSLDGVTKNTVEKIRVGCDFDKIVGNIMALRDLKRNMKHHFPVLFMDFVLMNSNIHEAPAFVSFCKELDIDLIDFRHMVGNAYFSEHEEMLGGHKEKYNFYRKLIIEESKKVNIQVRLPEPFETDKTYVPEDMAGDDLLDYKKIVPDKQTIEVADSGQYSHKNGEDSDFPFLSHAQCLRPFNEIMINGQVKILPCSYYGEIMGTLDEENTLYSIFFSEKFSRVRQKKLQAGYDVKCHGCPIKSNLLPTKVEE
jgi:molybdenum cofactor biosynthesis enzyme MoaA